MAQGTIKARVFIGGSASPAGKAIAEALALGLAPDFAPHLWTQDVFRLSKSTLDSLIVAADSSDFAVLVLTADDALALGDQTVLAPRGNVLFELGLFMGSLGTSRTFFVYNEDQPPSIPTNLHGITAALFSDPEDGNLTQAVGIAAIRLKQEFGRLGQRKTSSLRQSGKDRPSVYWCAPHRNVGRNSSHGALLESHGIEVLMPNDLVGRRLRSGETSSEDLVRDTCMGALLASSLVVVDLDTYGLDSAWEIGYAEAKGIPVIGFSIDEGVIVDARQIRRKLFRENFMHGWAGLPAEDSLEDLLPHCDGKTVYACGSFRNEAAMQELRSSELSRRSKRLILPKDVITLGSNFPAQYPYRAREQAIGLLATADVGLVILPRYGMDTSWQIGYASGLGKPLVGWITEDVGPPSEETPIWSHWMHGWKEKITTTRLTDISAIVLGFHSVYK